MKTCPAGALWLSTSLAITAIITVAGCGMDTADSPDNLIPSGYHYSACPPASGDVLDCTEQDRTERHLGYESIKGKEYVSVIRFTTFDAVRFSKGQVAPRDLYEGEDEVQCGSRVRILDVRRMEFTRNLYADKPDKFPYRSFALILKVRDMSNSREKWTICGIVSHIGLLDGQESNDEIVTRLTNQLGEGMTLMFGEQASTEVLNLVKPDASKNGARASGTQPTPPPAPGDR